MIACYVLTKLSRSLCGLFLNRMDSVICTVLWNNLGPFNQFNSSFCWIQYLLALILCPLFKCRSDFVEMFLKWWIVLVLMISRVCGCALLIRRYRD